MPPGLAGDELEPDATPSNGFRKRLLAHDHGLALYLAPRFTPVRDSILTPTGRSAFDRAVRDAEAVLAAVPAPLDRARPWPRRWPS